MGPVAYISLCLLGCLVFNPSLTAPGLSVEAQAASCPTGWLSFQGSFYGYFSQEKNWRDAEAECQRYGHGVHLASIHSVGENNILAQYVAWEHKKSSHVWIGLKDTKKSLQNRTWIWADESRINFPGWATGQPDNQGKNEHCVVLPNSTGFKKWHDYSCEGRYSFVCKHSP